ncbi:coenzyme F420-reducing hydrogenase, beta subunit [Halogeometricum borinquense DSM 11551]|uniref:Coenzyme F420-reducing hydrogenase, beta subunit n=1 Tax=Halogeometricum borinquense (strain ATCC 700274 / DSM 11551 / JCM 10706 / KCTC 4070 / PR3) TaxID=469382 RepID=E4NW87_HALBP|nr:Coenzyme F420 hydrogenase/dehydrogenase, beta subunit C-terminal domain [Halogeometricum borinquense]ADQ69307.1 coenzyme F420-reducing hydrogenase, beta subunit [Halogeometricum borinquense DSM 11551]ELY31790.1 coenzyme F420-reducing hydrogenase, beta subunit [Halogeometricum borinquense DSM 11551]
MTAENTENEREQPLPHVPDTGGDERRDVDVGYLPVGGHRSGSGPRTDSDLNPITYRRRSEGSDDKDAHQTNEECRCGRGCGCDGGPDRETTNASPVSVDGGTRPSNVDSEGNLTTFEFTTPSEGKSQDVSEERPDRRVQVPEGVDLDTPDYSIRGEMNDIDEPDNKTWFMELDAAVIDEGRCIQCGTCVASCPSDSIGLGDDGLPKLVKMCTGCSLCWDFCPRGGLRYERQWKITGGDDNVNGAGDPITEFSAKVEEAWRENAQDGGLVTSVLIHLLEAGEIDGAIIATESADEPWKAESFLATTPEELIENAGSFYNQTMALGNLNVDQWAEKLPEKDPEALSLALVGTPCEIEGIRALQDFAWDYASQEDGIRAIDYTIALMCTKNFNYERLIGEQLEAKRGIDPDDIGKMDVLHGDMLVYDRDGEMILQEDIEAFHGAALKGCDECADFTGYCADLTVGSVGSGDEYSSVIVRTEQGLKAWELTEPDLDYHDLEDRSAIGRLQSWDKKKAFESLQRPFDPDAPRFIEYPEHAGQYDVVLNPHESQ